VFPLALYLLMLQRLIEQLGTTDWGRLFVFASACFGTFITTFSVTLNNHMLATISTLVAAYPFLIASYNRNSAAAPEGRFALPSNGWLLLSGISAGLTACLELPALTLVAALALAVLVAAPLRALLFLAPALLVFGSEFGLNKLALGAWLPIQSKFGDPWYEYPGSHWLRPGPGQVKHGIDFAREHESVYAYAFNCLVGHHGLFSLTPIWLLSFAAMIRRSFSRRREPNA